ncbi:MAG: hypothetical protein JKY53_06405 [Flavobacteriales bacterium]|nr:hypothetical protein [Flavobacteriales bacterium]
MIKKIIIIFISVLLVNSLLAGVIIIEGEYQNRNIYIQNSISYSGVGYCTYAVLVNGQFSTDEINSDAFEISLDQFQLEIGAPVMIEIRYKDDGCIPKVLNPNALLPNPTFETSNISIDNRGNLQWSTTNENAKLSFIIEQFKWNKWVQVGQVDGNGGEKENHYQFQTTPHSGRNKYRIKQKGYIDKTKYSPSVSYTSIRPEISYLIYERKQTIEFTEETSFEVYDKFGNLVKKGHGSRINIANLQKDTYYMNYGNSITEFKKK